MHCQCLLLKGTEHIRRFIVFVITKLALAVATLKINDGMQFLDPLNIPPPPPVLRVVKHFWVGVLKLRSADYAKCATHLEQFWSPNV